MPYRKQASEPLTPTTNDDLSLWATLYLLGCLGAFPIAKAIVVSGWPEGVAVAVLLLPFIVVGSIVCRDPWSVRVRRSSADYLRRNNLRSFSPFSALLATLVIMGAEGIQGEALVELVVNTIRCSAVLVLGGTMLYDIHTGRKRSRSDHRNT